MTTLIDVKTIIKSLIISSPTEISISQLSKDYKRVEGCPIPYYTFGYKSLDEFLRSMPETIVVLGQGSQATIKFVGNAKSNHIYELVQHQKKDKKFSRFSNQNQRKYLKNALGNTTEQPHFNNQMTADISPQYHNSLGNLENHQQSNVYSSLGCGRISFINKTNSRHNKYGIADVEKKLSTICMKDTNEIKESSQDIERSIYQSKVLNLERNSSSDISSKSLSAEICKFKNSISSKFRDIDNAIPDFAADTSVFQIDFPKNVIKVGQHIPNYVIPEYLKPGSLLKIFVTEVHNPFKFWFHIHEENSRIDDLMNNMEIVYKNVDEDEYNIPPACIAPGQICAALYNGNWHRAEILTPICSNNVKCFFVDYGTVNDVAIEKLKYLLTSFGSLPIQAMRGSLSSIKPNGLHWSIKSTEYFISLVRNVMLYAQIREIDDKNGVFYLVICNTTGENAIQINKELVLNKYALLNANWDEERIINVGRRTHHPREDYPTFSMIESGVYPSLSELIQLENIGINYERMYDNYICNPGNLSMRLDVPPLITKLSFGLLTTNPFLKEIIEEMK